MWLWPSFISWVSEAQKGEMSYSSLQPIGSRTRPRTRTLDLRGFVLPSMFCHHFIEIRDGETQWAATLGSKGVIVSHCYSVSIFFVNLLLGREVAGETLGEQDVRAGYRPGDLPYTQMCYLAHHITEAQRQDELRKEGGERTFQNLEVHRFVQDR